MAIVAFDLAPEVGEDERSWSDDEEPEETEPVGEPTAEHGAGDEMEEREDDDLLVVGGTATRRDADDLKERGELDHHVDRGLSGDASHGLTKNSSHHAPVAR